MAQALHYTSCITMVFCSYLIKGFRNLTGYLSIVETFDIVSCDQIGSGRAGPWRSNADAATHTTPSNNLFVGINAVCIFYISIETLRWGLWSLLSTRNWKRRKDINMAGGEVSCSRQQQGGWVGACMPWMNKTTKTHHFPPFKEVESLLVPSFPILH